MHLVDDDAEGPDVGLDREPMLERGLGRGPLDRELGVRLGDHVLLVQAELAQAEVGHLSYEYIYQQ